MGFSLETFFADLIALMDSDMKSAKKLPRICRRVWIHQGHEMNKNLLIASMLALPFMDGGISNLSYDWTPAPRKGAKLRREKRKKAKAAKKRSRQ
jgi:hypothetical protein